MSITLRITLQASARAAAGILNYVEELCKVEAGVATIENVEPVIPVKKPRAPRAAKASPAPVTAPVTEANPFVAEAVASSTTVRRIITDHEVIRVPGRNRVVYMVTSPAPERAVIFGVPRQLLDILNTRPQGMSAKELEVESRLKQKSVESAIYALRTQGVIHSVEV